MYIHVQKLCDSSKLLINNYNTSIQTQPSNPYTEYIQSILLISLSLCPDWVSLIEVHQVDDLAHRYPKGGADDGVEPRPRTVWASSCPTQPPGDDGHRSPVYQASRQQCPMRDGGRGSQSRGEGEGDRQEQDHHLPLGNWRYRRC